MKNYSSRTKKNTSARIIKHTLKKPTSGLRSGLRSRLIIGCHASISPSILDGIKYLDNIGGNAVQIFLGSNRSASMKTKTKLTNEDILAIRKYLHHSRITLIVHSIYLLNFCKAMPGSGRVQYMHDNIQHDLKLGAQLGATCIILHLGFKNDMPIETAMKNLIANINKIIRDMPKGIMLSLETSAGSGTQIGYTLEELANIWNGVKHNNSRIGSGMGSGMGINKKVGICIDTAHIFVSGVDISSVLGIQNYLNRFDKLIGWKNITNFHINDSRYASGTRKDEHRGIGSGLIYNTPTGKQALKYIKTFCQKRKIPMILETHGAGSNDSEGSHAGEHGYKWEIEMIKHL